MVFHLHFYSLPLNETRQLPADSASVPAFIQASGKSLGTMEFKAGEAILFLSAAEDLTGLELMGLLESPIRETEPSDDYPFGGMEAEEIRAVRAAIDAVLGQMDEETAGLAHMAEAHDLTPERLLALLKVLHQIMGEGLEAGGEFVTLYS
ncbi:MAG: hypothetical protein WC859_04090 [Elusimicrobiota bacterium]